MIAPTPMFAQVARRRLAAARYGVRQDGSVVDLYGHGLTIPVSTMDLVRGRWAGLNRGDPKSLILYCTWGGRGNGIHELWTAWAQNPLGQLVTSLAAQSIVERAANVYKRRRISKDQAIAEVWVREQGLTSPQALREFVDKRRKGWKSADLSRMLRVTDEAAELLLDRLGYERAPLTDDWQRGDSFAASAKRTEWMRSEYSEL